MTHLLDASVWGQVDQILRRPEVIRAEVARLSQTEPMAGDLVAIELQQTELKRQSTNLAHRLAAIDDEAVAALLLDELKRVTAQASSLDLERQALLTQR